MFSSRRQSNTVNLITIQANVHFMNEQSGIDGFEFQCLKTDQMKRETAVYFMIDIYRKHADILVCSSHKTHHMAWEDMKHSAQVEWTTLMTHVLLLEFYGLFVFGAWQSLDVLWQDLHVKYETFEVRVNKDRIFFFFLFFGLTLYTWLYFSDNDVDGQYLHLSGLWRKRPKPYLDCNCFSWGRL